MKFSEQWLRGWVSPQVSRDELVARLSMAGLEVDSVTLAAGVFTGVVVAMGEETVRFFKEGIVPPNSFRKVGILAAKKGLEL